MKFPCDLSGAPLAKALARIGFSATRQTGSHLRLTSASPSEHHVTIPLHGPLRVGTLAAILADVADHREMSRGELLDRLSG